MLAGFLVICYSQGWRLLGFIMRGDVHLRPAAGEGRADAGAGGATIGISALAEPEHRARPLGVLGLIIFLLALCWWVFIKQLDIRVAVWPLQF